MEALRFHKNHGKNIELSSDGQTISRKDRSQFHDGVALTSRPLRTGEMFEVMLCEQSARCAGKGGLEIGVTTNNPSSFRLPKDMTDCRENINVMLAGQDLVQNKTKKDLLNTSTYDIKVGGILGVCLRQGGKVDFYVNKQCVATGETKYVGDIWGVVDLYGQASKAAIYTGQEPPEDESVDVGPMNEEDLKKLVENAVRLMQAKDKDYKKAHSVFQALRQSLKSHTGLIIEILMKENTLSILTEYIVFLKQQQEDHNAKVIYLVLLNLLITPTDGSRPFCVSLGRTGFFQIIAQELKLIKTKKSDETIQQSIIMASMTVLHNCVKAEENVRLIRPMRLVEVIQHCIDRRKYKSSFVITSVMAMSYLVEENEATLARMTEETCNTVLEWLKKAISDENHRYDGWSAEELCEGLANLAADFINLKYVVQRNGHVLFARLLLYGENNEREAALRALQAHTCPQSCKLISSVPKMLELLQATIQKGTEACKVMAADVLRQLEACLAKNEKPQKSPNASGDISQSVTQGSDLLALLAALSLGEKTCSYKEKCKEAIKHIGIRESYFQASLDRCSCEECWSTREDEAYSMRGEPPKKYSLAKGWCRLGLKLPPKAHALQVGKKWHKAFHGSKQRCVKTILDLGELALPGAPVLGGVDIYERSIQCGDELKVDVAHKQQIFVSPSIHYAGSSCYATPHRWTSSSTGKAYDVKLAFELFIAPKSYTVGPQSVGMERQIDPQISNSEIEWTTSQQGSTILYGLLVHLEEV